MTWHEKLRALNMQEFHTSLHQSHKRHQKPEYEAGENAAIEELQIQCNQNKLQEENTFGGWKKHWASQEAACWSSGCVQIRLDKSQADSDFVKEVKANG